MALERTGTRLAMVGALIVVTAIPAIVNGLWNRRWHDQADMNVAAEKLLAFPRQLGDWRQQGDEEKLPDEAIAELQCAGYFNRRYVNQKLGRYVTVMLMVGPAGPLVRHPPEICYGNRANKLLQEPTLIDVPTPDSTKHTLRLLRYKNPSAATGEFTVCYGWSDDGTWAVPEYPRFTYGGVPLLFKLQVLTTDTATEAGTLPVATQKFLDEFLPRLRDAIRDGA